MRTTCTNCGGAHAIWDCKRPAQVPRVEAVIPQPVSKEATHRPVADLQEVDTNSRPGLATGAFPTSAGTVGEKDRQLNPPKRKRGRPPTGFDKKAYDAEFMRKKRARLKAEREAAK